MRAPAGSVLQHRRVVDAPHHLAARPVVLGDAERLPQVALVEAQRRVATAAHAERVPGARGVIVGRRRVERDAGAKRDLVADDESSQQLRPVERAPTGVREREQRRGARLRRHGPS